MKNLTRFFVFLLLGATVILVASKKASISLYKEGDIVFMKDNSAQGKAVKLATHSEYSHVGIILNYENELYLYEAVQPVRRTKFSKWLAKKKKNNFVIKRLEGEEPSLNKSQLAGMKIQAIKHLGKNYDPWFGWSDDRIYCSEYVWKIYYQGAGLALCSPKKMEDYDLSHPLVIQLMNQRYKTIPLKETMVSPGDLFNSNKLLLVNN